MLPVKRAAAASFALTALALLAGCGKPEQASAPGGPAASAAKAGECGDASSACEIACESEKLSASAPAAPAAPAAAAQIPVAGPGQRLVYTVHASGVGWSAGDKARAAMESLPGIVDLKMSGTVGTFSLAEGKTLDETTARKAVEANGLTFERMEVEARGAAAAVWKLEVDGPTWATTQTEVRSNLRKLPGVAEVIFGNPVEIEVSDPAKYDRAAVEKTLTDGGFTVKKAVQQ